MDTIAIMQMSDLHRTASGFPNSKVFVSSIKSDFDRFDTEEPSPPTKPDILIFCGDVIQGASKSSDFDEQLREIQKQYDSAKDVLNRLCAALFDGEKRRIIIVPGNHDVSWPHSRRSMKKIEPSKDLHKLLRMTHSDYRWNWENLSFYKISNIEDYRMRFLPFSEFYSIFYEGKRKYSLNPEEQFDIFEYPDLDLVVVGFNSCFRNDHLRTVGLINSECIATCHERLSQSKYDPWLKIAVWHHDIQGYPFRQAFMDDRTLQFLIDKGFNIGLHGHNHKTSVLEVRFSVDGESKMNVFGCGSLGAFGNNLPLGESRHYALLELSKSDENVRFHLRKAIDQPPDLPIWMQGSISENRNKSYIDSQFINILGKKIKMSISYPKELVDIERLVSDGNYSLALEELKKQDKEHPIVHRLMIECYWQKDMDKELITTIGKPRSIIEFTYLSQALWREKEFSELRKLLEEMELDKKIASSEAFKRMKKKMEGIGYGENKISD